jgi:hypothetical protein
LRRWLVDRGIAAVIVAALAISAAAAWHLRDRTSPSWDDGYYLTQSLALYDTLADRGVAAYSKRFLTIMQAKPPLIAALPTPVYLAVGRRYRAAYAVNLLFLALMFGGIYGICKGSGGPRAGLIAVAVLASAPTVYGLSHWYLVECGLVALVCAAIYVMAQWSESSGAGRATLLGVVFGLGCLMKASFPVYVAIPIGWLAFVQRKTALRRRPVIAFLAAAALVAGPWYIVNFRHMVGTALRAGSAETAKIYGTGAALSVQAIGHYLYDVANAAPWLYVAVLPLLAVLGASALRSQSKRGLMLALLWLVPLFFLAIGHYRDLRYAAPLYPALALLFALLADAAIRSRGAVATLVICAVVSLGWLSMAQNTFGVSGMRLELGGLLLDLPRFSYARPYDPRPGPQNGILAAIHRDSIARGRSTSLVLLGTDAVQFNADNFTLASVQARLPLRIETTAYITDQAALAQAIGRAHYFVYEAGGGHDQPNFNTLRDVAVRDAWESGQFTELQAIPPLPDGGTVHVLARSPEAIGNVPPCNVTFGGQLQLAGIGVSRIKQGLEVKYRWRCLARMDRDYWCFTHVVNHEGKVIGYLDHRFLEGDPPTHVWNPGDSPAERLVFPLPDGDSSVYELRIGVYYPASGERLAIAESTLPLMPDGTAAVVGMRPKVP